MKTALFPCLLSLSLLLSSCGESFVKVAERNRAGLDSLQADMKQLSDLIAANPGEVTPGAPLDPSPVFINDDGAGSNTAMVIHERLTEFDQRNSDKDLMDLYLSNGIENCFIWATWDEKAFDSFESELQNAIGLRYLVGYRTLEYIAPRVDAQLNYTIGGARLGVYVFDREKKEIVCAFSIAGTSSETVEYQFRADGSNQADAAQSWARSSLWENLRKAILPALAEKTGGTFEL